MVGWALEESRSLTLEGKLLFRPSPTVLTSEFVICDHSNGGHMPDGGPWHSECHPQTRGKAITVTTVTVNLTESPRRQASGMIVSF